MDPALLCCSPKLPLTQSYDLDGPGMRLTKGFREESHAARIDLGSFYCGMDGGILRA